MSDWHVIVVEGHERELRAFVTGFVADRHTQRVSVVLGDDVGLEHESVHERLRSFLKGGHHALLVPHDLAAALVEGLGHAGSGVGLRIVDRHRVSDASFAFAAEVFSRKVATDIRAIVRDMPAGVHLAQHSEQEEELDEEQGVDLYAPVHRYAYRVRGTIAGALAGILEMRRRLGEIEAVRIEPLHLA